MRGRKAPGLTQEQVAVELKVEPETISRFERGATLSSIPTLERIAEILRTTMGALLEEVEPRQFTEAEQLAALLRPLSDSDCAHAREILEKLSTHLSKRETPKRKRIRK
jgi:transcriptional regulator with XRE-family HTH domain